MIPHSSLMFILLGTSILSAIGMVAFVLKVGSQGHRDSSEQFIPDKEEMKKHLVWNMFYMNPKDPRGWVPKVWGYGVTVNFRSLTQIKVFSVLVIIALVSGLSLGYLALKLTG